MTSQVLWRSFSDLPRAYGDPPARGLLRVRPEDFQVDEISRFEPDGEGEHALLRVRKTGVNTEWVARRLAAHAGLPVSGVGYAGLKDRHAVTSQWFSLHLGPRAQPDWGALDVEGVELLEVHRHRRKLRRGALCGNRFLIRVRNLAAVGDLLEQRIVRVRELGVPNYFGPQRFGNGDGNLTAADALFAGRAKRVGRHLRGLWISAARSQLFNELLALRVERGDWDRALDGDCMQLDGSRSYFRAETVDDGLLERLRTFDIHPSGPLWGEGDTLAEGQSAELERSVVQRFSSWADGLGAVGLHQERRALRLQVSDLTFNRGPETVELAFVLPAGAYATAVLREIVHWIEPGRPRDPEVKTAEA